VIDSDTPEYVLILSGDHVYEMDYRELLSRHVATNADVTIAAIEHPIADATHFGVLEVNKDFRVTGFEEKPLNPRGLPLQPHMALVSMGVYVFKKDVLIRNLVENCQSAVGYDFGHNIIPALIHSARVYAYNFRDEMKKVFPDRESVDLDIKHEASMDLVRPEPLFNPYRENRWHSGPRRFQWPPCVWRRSCSTVCVVARSPYRTDSSVEQSVLMPGVRVGQARGFDARSLRKVSRSQRIFRSVGRQNTTGKGTLSVPKVLLSSAK
jgi:glucose-1-phosphate adenylyltransferase